MNIVKPTKQEVSFLAKIANSSYIQPMKRPMYVKTHLPTLIYDGDNSDRYVCVLLDNRNKIVYISVRGTELSYGFVEGFQDLIQDVGVSLRLTPTTRRFRHVEKILLNVMKQYPSYKIKIVGHSLGGSISADLSKKYKLESHNFSTGSGIRSLRDFDPRERDKSTDELINYYHTPEFDLLSSSSKILPGKHYFVKKKPNTSSHSLNNFLI